MPINYSHVVDGWERGEGNLPAGRSIQGVIIIFYYYDCIRTQRTTAGNDISIV